MIVSSLAALSPFGFPIDRRRRPVPVLLLAAAFTAVVVTSPAGAATLVPDTTADDDLVNGNCTLREAVEAAETDSPVDQCPAGDPGPTVDEIVLSAGSYGLDHALVFTTGLSITGAGEAATELVVSSSGRVLIVEGGEQTLTDLTMRGGTGVFGGCVVVTAGSFHLVRVTVTDCHAQLGGCIDMEAGTLTLESSTVSDCTAGSGGGLTLLGAPATLTDSRITGNRALTANAVGGGIYLVNSPLDLVRTRVDGNRAGAIGGGIRNNGGALTLTDSTVDGNTSGANGAGIASTNSGSVVLTGTTLSGNVAANFGGGLFAIAQTACSLVNSTLSGNRARDGGGLYQRTGCSLDHVTLAGNVASRDGGAVYVDVGTATFTNTLVAGGCDGSGSFASAGGNLESPGATCGLVDASDQTGIATADLALAPLAANGGPTRTHGLLPGSFALDSALAAACQAVDQRGEPRAPATCDTGSVEVQPDDDFVALFTDGFESGDTTAWSATVPRRPAEPAG